MSNTYRIGLFIMPADPFWVQVREATIQHAQQRRIEIVPLTLATENLSGDQMVDLLDDLMAQELEALISQRLPRRLANYLLNSGLPIIYTDETNLRHPRLSGPRGLYRAAQMAADYLVGACAGRGRCIMVAGNERDSPTSVTRISGFVAALRTSSQMTVETVCTHWRYADAYTTLQTLLSEPAPPFSPNEPLDALFGLSDSVVLAAADLGRELGFVDQHTRIAGINGDPLALAAIVEGKLHATVETAAADLAADLVEHACRAARGDALPDFFPYKLRLVTQENVAQVSAEKLIAIAELPSRLVDVNQRQELQRVRQLEVSLAINERSAAVLNEPGGIEELANLIGARYGFSVARLLHWNQHEQTLRASASATAAESLATPLDRSAPLRQALLQNRPVYIADTARSQRFAADPDWPATRTRVVLPIRHGQRTLGLLDLHSPRLLVRTQAELDALQSLADQLGGVMQNARLFAEARQAQHAAERASQLKTRLLTNVSHELRTPLNVILGYSLSALEEPSPYGVSLPPLLRKDLRRITESGEHLVRLINDLLDLSQAESGTLAVYPEPVDTHAFLSDLFESVAASLRQSDGVKWQLQLSERLPPIMADPMRLRQILLNLLSNAAKFTARGRIALGAVAGTEELHIWVEDTGRGIPVDLQSRIFEAFASAEVTSSPLDRSREGIGLGLGVTQQLVRLHGGSIQVDSLLGYGTTVHLYWPLSAHQEAVGPAKVRQPTEPPLAVLLAELTAGASAHVRRALEFIHAHYERELSREELAAAAGISPNYVTRVFRRELGLTPWQYLNRYRVAQAQRLLRESSASITDVAAAVGFNDPAYFSRIFRRESGTSPLAFRTQLG